MADDYNQRPYRGNERPARPSAPAGNDPLAELARLIGQNDPFSEFGRDGSRRAAPPRQAELAPAWPDEPARLAPAAPQPQQPPLSPPRHPQNGARSYGSQDFTRQPFGGAPLAVGNDVYHTDNPSQSFPLAGAQPAGYAAPNYDVPGYGAPGYAPAGFPPDAGYEQEQFQSGQPQFGPQLGTDDDYYDDVPPSRRRIGVLAIAGVFALAVVGTAGAFGYRAIFGSSSASPPPVIKAEQAPSKIVPAAASKDAQSNRMITDRGNDRAAGERLVSREEQPVVVTTTNAPGQAQAPQLGSGVIGTEPKRIRTIAIKPDQPADAMAPPADLAPQPQMQSQPQLQPQPVPQAQLAPPPRVVTTQRAAPVPVQAQPQAPTPVRLANPPPQRDPDAEPEQARAQANAPLSLNPNASAPAPARNPAPQRTAAAPAAATGGSGYGVQVSAQRSEEEAQAAFRSLQGKFPSQLGGRAPFIKRVDLGDKGIYFRAMVGPFADSGQANELCSSLKSAGGTCLVQKN